MRVTRFRELVAEGHSPSVLERVPQSGRQAIYRVPKPRPAAARRSAPPACEVDAAVGLAGGVADLADRHPTVQLAVGVGAAREATPPTTRSMRW
jgi:hypothetical protein